MSGKPECYGQLFPDLDRLEPNRPCRGKVFTVLIRSAGVGVQSRDLTVDEAQWETCQACPWYRSCYDLGSARLSLWDVVQRL